MLPILITILVTAPILALGTWLYLRRRKLSPRRRIALMTILLLFVLISGPAIFLITEFMHSPKRLILAVVFLSVALTASLVGLAWALSQNYWWRRSVDLVADEAGASWAMSSFRRGHLAIWEINPTNDFPRFSGRHDGLFEIWLDEYHADMPAPWQYAERRKIESHNRQMRYMYKHPERFTPGKDERKQVQPDGSANGSQTFRSETNSTSPAADPLRLR